MSLVLHPSKSECGWVAMSVVSSSSQGSLPTPSGRKPNRRYADFVVWVERHHTGTEAVLAYRQLSQLKPRHSSQVFFEVSAQCHSMQDTKPNPEHIDRTKILYCIPNNTPH